MLYVLIATCERESPMRRIVVNTTIEQAEDNKRVFNDCLWYVEIVECKMDVLYNGWSNRPELN